MMASRADETLQIREVRTPRLPASERIHRPFVVVSLVMATLVGFILGIHVPLGRLLDSGSPERTADLIQAHGQVQLLGFAGLFVIGMSLRLMPRFASTRVVYQSLVMPTLCLIAGGLLLRALVMPWFEGAFHSIFLLISVFAVLVGSACFLLIIGSMAEQARRFDASSLAFVSGALFLFAASVITALAAIEAVRTDQRSLSYLTDTAILHLQLFGFLVSYILGVALRAIPTMLAIDRPGVGATRLVMLLISSVIVLVAALLYTQYVDNTEAIRVIASLAVLSLGILLISLVWLTGVIRQIANRIRAASQASLWLIRSALLWMLFTGAVCVYFGASAAIEGRLLTQAEFDAVRHALGVGVVTILIVGMAMMILPEVAMARQGRNYQKQIAFALLVLLNISVVCRVAPSLMNMSWSYDARNLSMAVAGSLAETALISFTVFLLRLFWQQRVN